MEAWYGYMRHLPYTWEEVLEEDMTKTFIGMDYIEKEIKHSSKNMKKGTKGRLGKNAD